MNIVGEIYHLQKKIGAGSFGQVYSGENTENHQKIAAKTESITADCPQLSFEYKLYKYLSQGANIPKVYWYGQEKKHNIMVMQLLGRSLESLLHHCGNKFSMKTVLMIADQMLAGIQYIHSKNFIHRDIKPDNFVMGIGKNSHQLYVIDFGLSKKYRDPKTHLHISYIEGKSLTGTARYASVGALEGHEQSRRDDLEAIGYVLIYLLKGTLPWMGLDGRTREEKYKRIALVKSQTPFTTLCKGLPQEFVTYFETVKALHFTETPNYSFLRKLFRDLFIHLGYIYDYCYDWVKNEDAPLGQSHPSIPIQSSQNISLHPQISSTPNLVHQTDKNQDITNSHLIDKVSPLKFENRIFLKELKPTRLIEMSKSSIFQGISKPENTGKIGKDSLSPKSPKHIAKKSIESDEKQKTNSPRPKDKNQLRYRPRHSNISPRANERNPIRQHIKKITDSDEQEIKNVIKKSVINRKENIPSNIEKFQKYSYEVRESKLSERRISRIPRKRFQNE